MFSLLCLSSSQLLKKWAPVFKNYVKRAQDHLDCLSAFEEHFLEQDSHWPAMVKVRVSTTYTQWSAGCYEGWTQEQEKNMGFFFFSPGPDEHVPAGDPGGGDDPALVLPGGNNRQEQTAQKEPGGTYRAQGFMTELEGELV